MKTLSRWAGISLVGLSLVAGLACSRAEPSAPTAPPVAAAGSPQPVSAPGGAAEPAPPGRLVISEAELSIRSQEPDRVAEDVSRVVADRGGFVVSKEAERGNEGVYRVELVVRVPAAQFEPTLAELRTRGTVLKESADGRDVTEEYTDTEAQLRAKRRVEERLLAIVETSKTVKEMLEVESELGRVRGDIERLEGHSHYLANRAALATIRLALVSPRQPAAVDDESARSRIRNAVAQARSVFVSVTAGLIVALGAFLPAAVPAVLVLVVRRGRRRLAFASTATPE